jgi:hypothetical protein
MSSMFAGAARQSEDKYSTMRGRILLPCACHVEAGRLVRDVIQWENLLITGDALVIKASSEP